MRTTVPFNDHWLFAPDPLGDDNPDSQFEDVTLPHTNILLPHHNFDNAEYQFISTYRKRFMLPEPLNGRHAYLTFDGAMTACDVFLNGHKLGEHKGGFVPFSFDLTADLRPSGENLLTVYLDSTERKDIPPYGYVVDYLTFGGIYRDVRLELVEPCHITHVFVQPHDVLTQAPFVVVDVDLQNQSELARTVSLEIELQDANGQQVAFETQESVTLAPQTSTKRSVTIRDLPAIQLWSIDDPALYRFTVSLKDGETVLDHQTDRFGFREAEFRHDGFYLNGQPLKLMGLNRHQTYPYIGAAAPARLQYRDADIIKHDLACNIVRTSHYPQSPHFLDRCDELGLLVYEELPGWQFIGDQDWQDLSLRDIRVMIERDCNHPSIILWGVRINESQDNEEFYTATNALAHQLDPTRQTGGTRYIRDSQFLEDVFTFNDFSNTVVDPVHTPYLITEFGGHMFPTKRWDQEERLVEHALRHAHVQSKQMGTDNVAGAIGWCAFDYNTHQEFGSGDHICYHGVMDIFRIPKYAGYFYESQIDPQTCIMLHAATVWSMGDRSRGGIDPLVIFSNCDEVEVFIGDTSLGLFAPDREHYPHLPHPPFQVPMGMGHLTWGKGFSDLRVVGYIGGTVAAEQMIASDGLPAALLLLPDDPELCADGADMTRLVFKIVDRFGNPLPYVNQVVSFEVEGPADLIGETPFALMGGAAALYLRARHEPGRVHIRATTPRLPSAETTILLR